jgi:hypothetical protein
MLNVISISMFSFRSFLSPSFHESFMGKKYVMASHTTGEETTISKGKTFPICFYLVEAEVGGRRRETFDTS